MLRFDTSVRRTYKMQEPQFHTDVLPLRDKMYRFARSILLRTDEAEDVTHDTLERLWRGREQLAQCRNIEAFVMTALRNGCYDRLRRRKLREYATESYPVVAVADESSRWSDRVLVTEAMKQLSESQREVLHLKDIEGYETHEIAEMMSTAENQIRMILSRARKRLREVLIKMMEDGTTKREN